MTVSRAISSLYLFQSKIEEAVNLVPSMCAEDKLKAVQFWNMVSEKLQDIVNNSAADINAVALKMDEEENAKMNLVMNNQENVMIQHNNLSVAEFANISSNYTICNDSNAQLHANVTSNELKPFISNSFSNIDKQSPNGDIANLTNTHELNSLNSNISESNIQNNQYLDIEHISANNCDTFSKDMQSSAPISILDNHNSDISLSPRKKALQLQASWTPDKKRIMEVDENFETNSPSVIINHKRLKKTETFPLNNDSFSQNSFAINTSSTCDNSENKCNENSGSGIEASNESNFEHMDGFEGSSSEELFQACEINESPELDIKNSDDDQMSLVCKTCSKSFSDEDSLARHHLKIHERHYCCSECKAKFTTKGNLIVHMRRHTGEKPFCCHKCTANFTTKGNLQRHIKTHTGEKPWQCNKCGTCFTEKKSLTIHMRRHTGERPYQCKECGKRFSQTSILQTHMAMHMDLKIHLCEKCGKSFRQKSQLRVHRLRHDNVRPFVCSSCSSSFLTKGDLIRHEKIHTREKPYTCDVCSKCFTRQQSLNEHKNRHFGIKPYKCKHCGKAFPEMSGCYKHMKCHEKAKDEDNMKINELEPVEPASQPVSNKATEIDAVENQLPSSGEAPSYIAVVLNAKDPTELGNEINQAVTFLNSGIEESNIVPNGLGVLTAINILTNASALPQNFHSIS